MGIVLVEVCESNPAASLDLEKLEETYSGVTVIRNECLSHCELCAQKPYLMINGDLVIGEDLASLQTLMHEKIESELREWE